MYAITGITGKVGGAVAEALLAAGLPVRAVVRDAGKGQAWAARGCQVALAQMDDAAALALAFKDSDAVLVLPPSECDPAPRFYRSGRGHRRGQGGHPGSEPRQGGLPVDDWRPGDAHQPAVAAHADGEGARRPANARHFFAASLVHGERAVGCCRRARAAFPAFCSRSTSRCQWMPPPTSDVSRRRCSSKRGRAYAWLN